MRNVFFAALAAACALVCVPMAGAWTWPVDGPVLRPFVLGDDPYAGGQHRGVDVGAPAEAAVRAPAAGSVTFTGTVPVGGRVVTIRTSDGYAVTLVHLGTIGVARGAPVGEGEAVGTIGPSGEAEHAEPYVHLGVRVAADPNGYIDPLAVLPAPRTAAPVAEPAPAPTLAPQAEPAPVAGESHPSTPEPKRGHEPAPSPEPAAERASTRDRAIRPRARAAHG